MNKNLSAEVLLKIIDQALNEQGISARQASILATGGPELIRGIRRGSIPSVERIRALCEVLELEFYIGPARSESSDIVDSSEKSATIQSMFQEIISRLPSKSSYRKTAEPNTSYVAESNLIHYIPVLEMKATASKTTGSEDCQKLCYVAFDRDWFARHKLDFEHCFIMEVRNGSMEPTIAEHSIVLIDRSRCRRRIGNIYAIRINGDIVVKRLDKGKNGWQLVSDYPKLKSEPLPNSAKIIGEVKWTAKTFV